MKTANDNNSNWIWGIFYYNKNDDRIFPPKRIPWMGWTVNFANPKSVLVFVGMMAFFLLVYFLIKRNS
jgi:uncharacterized membrane protein